MRMKLYVSPILFWCLLLTNLFIAVCGFAQETPEVDTIDYLKGLPQPFSLPAVPNTGNVLTTNTTTEAGIVASTVVSRNGRLRVSGNQVVNQYGKQITLAGMSLYWHNDRTSQDCWTYGAIKSLVTNWGATVIRAPIGINRPGNFNDGYATSQWGKDYAMQQVNTIVNICKSLGVYVIIDFHTGDDRVYKAEAIKFFGDVSRKYGNLPNIIYEDWNEPQDPNKYMSTQEKLSYWADVLKPYHEQVIKTIRANNVYSMVIVGTGFYDQDVNIAAERKLDPKVYGSVAYALHFYARTHRAALRKKALSALAKGACLFVTEFGTTYAGGGGAADRDKGDDYEDSDLVETAKWINFCQANGIGHCQWAVGQNDEGSSALESYFDPSRGITTDNLTKSGRFARATLRQVNMRHWYDKDGFMFNATEPVTVVNGYYQILGMDYFRAKSPHQLSFNIYQAGGAGSRVILFPYSHPQNSYYAKSNEAWEVIRISGDYIHIVSPGSLALSRSTTNANSYLTVQGYSANNLNQRFRLAPVSTYGTLVNSYYIVDSKGYCIQRLKESNGTSSLISNVCSPANWDQIFFFNFLHNGNGVGARIAAETESEEKLISVYPNPSVSTFTINETEPYTFTIQNMLGRIVEEGSRNGISTVGEQLETGQYLIKINVADKTKVVKVIKQ